MKDVVFHFRGKRGQCKLLCCREKREKSAHWCRNPSTAEMVWEGSPRCWCSEALHWELKHWLCTKLALDCESCKESESNLGKEGGVHQQNWVSWFRWNENRWGVNSRLLLLWCLQLKYFLPLLFFLENKPLYSTGTLEGRHRRNWFLFQLDRSVIKACPFRESGATPPRESLINAGKAGDITAAEPCGLELCCHRIVFHFWNHSYHFTIALNSCLETLIGELMQNWLIRSVIDHGMS